MGIFFIDAITGFSSFNKAFREFYKSYLRQEPGRLPMSAKIDPCLEEIVVSVL